MKKNQDINKLFQDQLEHFEVLPDEAVWTSIASKLQEKKKRRVIPIWWFYSGIAAAFLIGLFLNFTLFTSSTAPGVPGTSPGDAVVQTPKTNGASNANNPINGVDNSTANDTNDGVDSSKKMQQSDITTGVATTAIGSKNSVAEKNTHSQHENNISHQKTSTSNKNTVAHQNGVDATQIAVANPAAPVNEMAIDKVPTKNNSTQTEVNVTHPVAVQSNPLDGQQQNNGTTTSNSIVSNNPLNSAKDSSKVAQKPTNELEKLLDEKEKKSFSGQNLNRWQVASHLAPIYFSSLSQGSPLDPALATNSKQYSANNTSYGIGVGYALNSKISIRTGVNIVRLGYDTDEIAYYMEPNVSSRIQNLSLNAMGSNIIIESLNNVKTYNKFMNRYEGSLNQRMGYLEVPMELTYRLGGKKMGIQFVGGFSSYFLNQNEIYLQSEQFNLLVGKATNLNSVHFSGNLGFGIHYGFFKKWEARIEPTFKYQFNTYSSDAGNFKPYLMGLYTGVSYSF